MEGIFNLPGLQARLRRLLHHHSIYTNSLNLVGIEEALKLLSSGRGGLNDITGYVSPTNLGGGEAKR